VPNFILRDKHFFGDFYEMLRKNENVKDMFAIIDAAVPLIRLKFCNI